MISDQLRDELRAFRKERDWEQFHNLRTLGTSIALEAAELMEHIRRTADEGCRPAHPGHRAPTPVYEPGLAEEMADIAILLTYLANDLRVDLETAVRQKLVKNAAKYPVEKAKGVATKYDRL
jgi:NTP pyrophosphatase (non-canonical NTP hydrolase)